MFFYSDLTTKRVLTPYEYFDGRYTLSTYTPADLIVALKAATPNQRINRRVRTFEPSDWYAKDMIQKSINRHKHKLAMHKR